MKAHRDSGAVASIGLKRVENPLEFGIVITRPDGSIERFLEKPSWGQVFSDTINTGIYVLEPQIFDFIPDGEVVDFSGDVFPAVARRGAHPPRPRRRRLLGGRRHHRVVPAAPTPTCSTGAVRVDIGGFQVSDGRVARGGRRPRPRRDRRRPGGDRRQLPRRGRRATSPSTRCSAPTWSSTPRRRSCAPCCTTTSTSIAARPLRGAVVGRSSDVREHARLEEGSRRRRRVLHRPADASVNAGREDLPVQDGRDRRDRELLDHLGDPRGADPLRPAGRHAGWPTSTSPPRSRCGSRWRTGRR